MKKAIFLILTLLLFEICPIQADTIWTSGYHEIVNNDVYWEIYIYDEATAVMFGGEVYKLETFDTTAFDIYGGQMDVLSVHDSSIVNIYGGTVEQLMGYDNSWVNLYAYDIVYDATGGYAGRGRLEGRYIIDDSLFSIDFNPTDTIGHINIVPEPVTLLLFGLGGVFIKRSK